MDESDTDVGTFSDRSAITKHVSNIYLSGELEEKATCAKFAQVQKEGKRHLDYKITISCGIINFSIH